MSLVFERTHLLSTIASVSFLLVNSGPAKNLQLDDNIF
jgi:hypothetical protein